MTAFTIILKDTKQYQKNNFYISTFCADSYILINTFKFFFRVKITIYVFFLHFFPLNLFRLIKIKIFY